MSKSRSGKTPNANQNAPPITTQNAIIPGKFMESDWNELLEIEDDENFISDIIDEITDSACQQMFDNIIKSRVQPHTVLAVRELLLDIIEWQFLQSDTGEKNTDSQLSWIEDEEPSKCVIDNWAQGAVPVEQCEDFTALEIFSEDNIEHMSEESSITEIALDSIVIDENASIDYSFVELRDKLSEIDLVDESIEAGKITDNLITSSDEVCNDVQKVGNKREMNVQQTYATQRQNKSKKVASKKYRPHVGSLPTFEKISLESVTDLRPKPGTREICNKSPLPDFENPSGVSVRKQYGRTSGPKEVVYDEKGNVVKVEKLNVANFPNHRVPVKYAIVAPEGESDKNFNRKSCKMKESTSVATKNKINAKSLLQKVHPFSTWDQSSPSENNLNVSSFLQYSLQPRSPLPPLMVDSMNVTDGVTIREGGLSKQVVKKIVHDNYSEKRSIHPMCSSTNKVLHVNDIVSDSSPTLRYISTSEGIPGM